MKILFVKFLDHAMHSKKPIECFVVGIILKDAKEYYTISHWVTDPKDKETFEENLELTTIIKSTILEKKIVKIDDILAKLF